jgi:hypothetical protein
MSTVAARRGVAAGVAAILLAVALPACSSVPRTQADPTAGWVLSGVDHVRRVGQVTGADAPGPTTRYQAGYMDLGSMFEADGRVWFVFGDTFEDRPADMTGGGGSSWRSNTMAWTTDDDPSDGITLDGMIVDPAGSAKELLSSKKIDGDEITVIPTYGFAVGDVMYLHYMSVRHWGDPGEWEVNGAGLARSTDHGEHWTKVVHGPHWGPESGFVQVSVAHATEGGTDWLYVWGITHGRFGGVRLARVPADRVEAPSAWRYYSGTSHGRADWSVSQAKAVLVVDDTVGELSVVWSDYLQRWIMTSSRAGTGAVIREGISPQGPWGAPRTLVSEADVPGLYAPFMLPRYTSDGGRTIYFTLSIWDPYEVFWYRADLEKRGG